jgi:hypothetical protein
LVVSVAEVVAMAEETAEDTSDLTEEAIELRTEGT